MIYLLIAVIVVETIVLFILRQWREGVAAYMILLALERKPMSEADLRAKLKRVLGDLAKNSITQAIKERFIVDNGAGLMTITDRAKKWLSNKHQCQFCHEWLPEDQVVGQGCMNCLRQKLEAKAKA